MFLSYYYRHVKTINHFYYKKQLMNLIVQYILWTYHTACLKRYLTGKHKRTIFTLPNNALLNCSKQYFTIVFESIVFINCLLSHDS